MVTVVDYYMNTKNLYAGAIKPLWSEWAVKSFAEHKFYLYFCLGFYLLSYLFLNYSINYSDTEIFTGFFLFLFNSLVFGFAVIGIYLTKLLIKERPKDSPIKYCYTAVCRDIFPKENRWRILYATIGLSLVISAFLVVKGAIPLVIPFGYDTAFEALDRSLHFGYQPWEILQPLLGHEWITLFLHRLYYLWFPVLYATFFWQVGTRVDKQLRMQFILSFVACWAIIGGLMATIFSSAGPIYYDQVVANSPGTYAAGMNYLLEIHSEHEMYMFAIKDILWAHYINPSEPALIKGISAMPSVHVSIAFLLALFGWKKGLYFGIGYSIFALLIFLGSIHLLWHYAVDGYVSIIVTAIIWLVCGKIVKSTQARQSTS